MCILFGKKARLLKEENANLKARIESLSKRAEKAEQNLREINHQYDVEIHEKISENTRLRNLLSGRDNTIKQLKVQLAKLTPCRGKNGRFTHKRKQDAEV